MFEDFLKTQKLLGEEEREQDLELASYFVRKRHRERENEEVGNTEGF